MYAERQSDADFQAFESIIGDVVALREVIEQISYADRGGIWQASEASYFGLSSDLLKTIASLRNYMGPLDSFSTSLRNRVFLVLGFSGLILSIYGGSISYRWYRLYDHLHHSERDRSRLASLPLNNPNPVFEFDALCNMAYFNTSTIHLFPDMESDGEHHGFFLLLKSLVLDETARLDPTHHQCIQNANRIACQPHVIRAWRLHKRQHWPSVEAKHLC